MSDAPPDQPLGPGRRSTLSGLVGVAGAALLTAGRTACETSLAHAPGSATASAFAGGPTPGAMTLTGNPEFHFDGLSALGACDQDSAEAGEVLTAVNATNKAGLSAQTYVETFRKLGDRLTKTPQGGRPDRQTRHLRALRASKYYAQSSSSSWAPTTRAAYVLPRRMGHLLRAVRARTGGGNRCVREDPAAPVVVPARRIRAPPPHRDPHPLQ